MIMRNKKTYFLGIVFFLISIEAQLQDYNYFIETTGISTIGKNSPFWFVSNQFDKYSYCKNSILINGGLFKDFNQQKIFDYSFGFEASNGYDTSYLAKLTQAYIKLKYNGFILGGGRIAETFGNADTTLTGGNLLRSGNAMPYPKLFFRTNGFINIPFTKGYVKVNANYSDGWLNDERIVKNTLVHHKNLYFLFGGDYWINFQIGLEHNAQWAGESPFFGKLPKDFDAYKRTVLVDSGNPVTAPQTDVMNRNGNHIASINASMLFNCENKKVRLYYQSMIDDDTGIKGTNWPDGFYAISVKSKDKKKIISGICYEFLYTPNQTKYEFPKEQLHKTYGATNYFNNGLYRDGWVYNGMIIASPFITSPKLNQLGNDKIINNCVIANHIGIEGVFKGYNYRSLISYSRNYGLHPDPFDRVKRQLSVLIETSIPVLIVIPMDLIVKLGIDYGKMYGNNTGILLTLRNQGFLFNK